MRLREDGYYRKAKKRLAKLPASAVLAWADSTLWATQAQLDYYRRTGERAALEEARKGAMGLLASVDNLIDTSR